LAVTGTPLETFTQQRSWIEHAREFDSAWSQLESRQLSKIHDWAQKNLAEATAEKGSVFYMFSGPDMLYAHAFFPHASTYVLCALEPVGQIPDATGMSAEAISWTLHNLRNSLNSVLNFSFFKTKDMKSEEIRALPILYVFLARANCKLQSAELVGLDDSGQFVADKATTHGAKITFTSEGSSQPQTLYYFSTNLANDGIKQHRGFINFCGSLGKGVGFAKAASYLMHDSYFSDVRDFLLAHCSAVVQDDSGIPVKYFAPDQWLVRYFGTYPGPIDLFKQHYQSAIAEGLRNSSSPLPFSFGYQWHSKQSSIIVATALKDIPKATPAETTPAPAR